MFVVLRSALAGLLAVMFAATAAGAASAGKTVWLFPEKGKGIAVATVTFAKDGSYAIRWDDTKFGDFFLSMRPFKCLRGKSKLWCRVPYPYRNRRSIAGGDLTDLEYDLMFVWKNAGEYGINLWNGVYYQLVAGGGRIIGVLHEFDMNTLAAPPESGNLRPITDDILDKGDAASHWLPRLVIE